MNDEENKGAAQGAADLGSLADFFAPSWAKDDKESSVRLVSDGGGRPPRGRDFDRGDRPRRDRDFDRRDRPSRDGGDSGERRERRDFERGDRPRRDRDSDRRERQPREGGADRGRRDFDRRGPRPERPAPEAPLALEVRFLPEGRALESILRRIVQTRKAYPFRDIVRLFQKDDSSLSVRIEIDKEASPVGKLYQCRACGMPALTEAELVEHIFSKHLGDYFDIETVQDEPPAGNFPCVAKCGLSGELLGPPNHHSYARRIEEMLRDRFPGMSKEEYTRHIEMVRDPEAVEQWREAARNRVLYFRKPEEVKDETPAPAPATEGEAAPAESAEPVAEEAKAAPERIGIPRAEAESLFRNEIMPGLMFSAPHVVCAATALKDMPNRRLASFLNREFSHDDAMRSQGSLSKALHAAFHHRKLQFFHANDEHGQEFVTAIAPVVMQIDNVTEEIRAIASFVAENPSAPQKALVDAMVPDGDADAVKKTVSSLKWLVEKGHIVEFFNGFLSPAAAHPFFSLSPKKAKTPEAKPNDAAETTEVANAETQPAEAPADAQVPVAEANPEPVAEVPSPDEAPIATEQPATDSPSVANAETSTENKE